MTKKRVVSTTVVVKKDKVGQIMNGGADHQIEVGTFDAAWDCHNCFNKNIPGNIKLCPTCGASREGTEEEYHLPPNSDTATPLTAEQLAERGVDPNEHFSDETCIHCGNRLKPGTTVCPHCHANLQDTAYTSRICRSCQTETNEAKCPQCGSDTDAKQAEAPSPTVVNEVYAPRVAINWMKIAVLAIIILAIAGLVYIFWPRQFNATLTNTRWETTQNIQEHQYNQYSGWDYPSNAINVSSVPKIHHYVNVETGEQEVCEDVPDCDTVQVYDYTVQEVNDDGTYTEYDVTRDETTCNTVEVCEMVTFYREDPVYQDWYTYYVWEWVNIEPCTQTGNSLPITYPDTTNLPENQRLDGDPTCTSTVYFETEDGDEKHKGVDCSDLASGDYPIGSQWILHTNGPIVSDLERK